MMTISFLVFLWASVAPAFAQQGTDPNVVAGSGTTNPSALLWDQEQILMDRSSQNLQLSYRATGSSTGKAEFLAYDNDFACSELPLTVAEASSAVGDSPILTLPFTLGGVSVFHSVPLGAEPLKMNAEILSLIFQRNITTWGATEILALNPGLPLAIQSQPITVVHRTKGSSSTSLLSEYLESASPVWVLGSGSTINWPTDTVSIFGSSDMASTIANTPYSIGYLAAGFGQETGLAEIQLENADGAFLSSQDFPLDLVADYAVSQNLIPCVTCDWSAVSLVNLPGNTTWPMVSFSYYLIRQNLTGRANANLVKAHLQYSLSDEGQAMNLEYGFASVGAAILNLTREGLDTLLLPADTTEYYFETGTKANVGAQTYVFSDRRQNFLYRNVDQLQSAVSGLESATDYLLSFDPDLELHGSGTTNPSKFIYKAMALMEARLQSPTTLTYRAVGSSTGIAEFMAGANQFGAGDIPFSEAQYLETSAKGELLHLPFVIGAVSVFQSAQDGLKFTPGVLAKIYSGAITTWDDQEILELNPGFEPPAGQLILVGHRTFGSSSTSMFTAYLDGAVDEATWPLGNGKTIAWPTGDNFYALEGSGGMADFVTTNRWAIIYVDSGFGNSLPGVYEIKLRNLDGNYVTSKDPAGIVSAANNVIGGPTGLPESFESWAEVTLVNQPGEATWPMCSFSYFYIASDQTATAEAGALLKGFVEFILSDEGQALSSEFGFVSVGPQVNEINARGLGRVRLDPTAVPYTFETSTDAVAGAGDRVVSVKRQSYLYNSVNQAVEDVKALQDTTAYLSDNLALELHGSGTTNPSKFFWKVCDLLESRLQSPAKCSYRAVGSSTGKKEFIAEVNGFGSGDIPMFAEDESQLAGEEYLQFPVLIGAVSVFFNLGDTDAKTDLRLTPSTLAKIFSREIVKWDDKEITDLNPDLVEDLAGLDITVVHRTLGSSSTYVFTKYLEVASPGTWALGGGSTIDWPEDTVAAEGSSGVAAEIRATLGSIGYLDSGFGQSNGFGELFLQNAAGKYVTSADPSGILAAATQAVGAGLPSNAGSWKDVSLLNLPGDGTWPMCSFTYVYARADQTQTGESGALLKAFLSFIMSEEGQAMLADFNFVAVGDEVDAINQAGLASIRLDPSAEPYTFETSTQAITGAGDRVISVKRTNWQNIQISSLQSQVDTLKAQLEDMAGLIAGLESDLGAAMATGSIDGSESSTDVKSLATAAIVLSALALVMLCFLTYRLQFSGGKADSVTPASSTEMQRQPSAEQTV